MTTKTIKTLPPFCIETRSGKVFDFRDPASHDYDIHDIAYALSKMCRYSGHCKGLYTVAQHSVLASEYVEKGFELEALLHDATEAYLGEVTSPLKALLPEYKKIEAATHEAIAAKFGLPFPMNPQVKKVDVSLLATEKRDLMDPSVVWDFLDGVPVYQRTIVAWSPDHAERLFLARFKALTEKT